MDSSIETRSFSFPISLQSDAFAIFDLEYFWDFLRIDDYLNPVDSFGFWLLGLASDYRFGSGIGWIDRALRFRIWFARVLVLICLFCFRLVRGLIDGYEPVWMCSGFVSRLEFFFSLNGWFSGCLHRDALFFMPFIVFFPQIVWHLWLLMLIWFGDEYWMGDIASFLCSVLYF